ncbi:hypothetical protein OH805_38300 [Streptomyces sp. NBC_00879]|uniref:hypothetical protein n=1 Tax=Streptomyces sp. NBC_00879 TaxID=2975855 RepID=UPI00386C5BCC|nr:hypothetical protein OH805_38300 [Streptomyces sp. NBC_00879]
MTTPGPDPAYLLRREAELRHGLASLTEELDEWKKAAKDQAFLEKHQSQVTRATRVINAAVEHLSAPTGQHTSTPELVLDLHHVWDFFRSKLILRQNPRYRTFLGVADELAWALYKAVREAAAPHLRLTEPPLTFLNRHPVPFAAARDSSFEDLLPSGRQRTLGGRRAADHLPFPVVGIPWSASQHLPALLSVAHETGHHIEDDFQLQHTLRTHMRDGAGLPCDRTAEWERWLGEVFADACATLACGTAYIWTLTDALAAAGTGAGTGSGDYPPPRLRVLACLAALPPGDLGPLPEVPGSPGPYDSEAAAVVRALIDTGLEELGGKSLASLLALRKPQSLPSACDFLRTDKMLSRRRDVPGVLAAATLVFVDDPAHYDTKKVGERAFNEVLELVPKGPRITELVKEDTLVARDISAGRELINHLLQSHSPQPTSRRESVPNRDTALIWR